MKLERYTHKVMLEDGTELVQIKSSAPEMLEALKFIAEEYEDRKCQFGGDYLWKKHETDPLPKAKAEGKEIS